MPSGSTTPIGRGSRPSAGALRDQVRDGREQADKLRQQGRRAELKLSQLASLTPEGFEEFVGEVFEALGFEVEHVGGTGDEGADLEGPPRRPDRDRPVQVSSAEGWSARRSFRSSSARSTTPRATRDSSSPRGRSRSPPTSSPAEHPIELIDGPRLVELVQEAMGPGARKEPEPAWF